MARLLVYIVPRSGRPGADGRHGGVPRLRVAAPASEGRANREAERLLAGLLGARVRLVGGGRSRSKVFETDLPPATIEERLRRAFGV